MMTALAVALLLQAAPQQYRLKFTHELPAGVTLDMVDTKTVEFEVALKQGQTADAKARGNTLGEWLVRRGICPDTNDDCRFILHFAGYVGTNPATRKMEFYMRYVARSDSGPRAEGFSRALTAAPADRAYWILENGSWGAIAAAAERERENSFFMMMLTLARAGLGQRKEPGTPVPRPLHPRVSAPVVT